MVNYVCYEYFCFFVEYFILFCNDWRLVDGCLVMISIILEREFVVLGVETASLMNTSYNFMYEFPSDK